MTQARDTRCPIADAGAREDRRARAAWSGFSGRARGYSTAALEKILGLLLLAVYIVAIVGLAALVTFAVVKIFPTERTPKKSDKQESSPQAPNGSDGGGKLFRKSKRGTA